MAISMAIPIDVVEQIRSNIIGTVVERHADEVIKLVRPAIGVDLEPIDSTTSAATSRLGGIPDVPPDWQWPTFVDTGPERFHGPLRFLAQIDLCDLQSFHGADLLPSSGILSFFYGPELFGASNEGELDVARVYHFANQSCAKARVPQEAVSPSTPYSLEFEQMWALPEDEWNLATKDLYAAIPEADREDFACALIDIGDASGAMQLLGYASREQSRFLEYKCEAFRQGYDIDTMYDSIAKIAEPAAQWELLAQFALSWEQVWPDGNDGYLHYWIRKSDLANKDFSQVCFTWERT